MSFETVVDYLSLLYHLSLTISSTISSYQLSNDDNDKDEVVVDSERDEENDEDDDQMILRNICINQHPNAKVEKYE